MKKIAETPEAKPYKEIHDKNITRFSTADAIFSGTAPDDVKKGYFDASTALWVSIKAFIGETLPAAIKGTGPFIGGEIPGSDDFHVGAWISRIALVLGAQKSDEGIAALEKTLGPLPEKTKAYWSAWTERASWESAFPGGNLLRTT